MHFKFCQHIWNEWIQSVVHRSAPTPSTWVIVGSDSSTSFSQKKDFNSLRRVDHVAWEHCQPRAWNVFEPATSSCLMASTRTAQVVWIVQRRGNTLANTVYLSDCIVDRWGELLSRGVLRRGGDCLVLQVGWGVLSWSAVDLPESWGCKFCCSGEGMIVVWFWKCCGMDWWELFGMSVAKLCLVVFAFHWLFTALHILCFNLYYAR